MKRVLFIDDDGDVRMAYGQALELGGYDVQLARAWIEARDHLTPGFEGVVVTDIRMPGRDGFDVLDRLARLDPNLPVIVLTGEGDIPMAVRAMQAGAFDFLEKPCPPADLLAVVERALLRREAALAARGSNGIETDRVTAGGDGLLQKMDAVERMLIEAALKDARGRVVAVAAELRLPRKTLYDKMSRHGLDPKSYR